MIESVQILILHLTMDVNSPQNLDSPILIFLPLPLASTTSSTPGYIPFSLFILFIYIPKIALKLLTDEVFWLQIAVLVFCARLRSRCKILKLSTAQGLLCGAFSYHVTNVQKRALKLVNFMKE